LVFLKEQSQAEKRLSSSKEDMEKSERILGRLIMDSEARGKIEYSSDSDSGITFSGEAEPADIKTAGARIIAMSREESSGSWTEFAKLGEFRLLVQNVEADNKSLFSSKSMFAIQGEGKILHQYKNGIIATENPETAVRSFTHALNRIAPIISQHEKRISESAEVMNACQAKVQEKFGKEDVLQELKKELKELEGRIGRAMENTEKMKLGTDGASIDDAGSADAVNEAQGYYRIKDRGQSLDL